MKKLFLLSALCSLPFLGFGQINNDFAKKESVSVLMPKYIEFQLPWTVDNDSKTELTGKAKGAFYIDQLMFFQGNYKSVSFIHLGSTMSLVDVKLITDDKWSESIELKPGNNYIIRCKEEIKSDDGNYTYRFNYIRVNVVEYLLDGRMTSGAIIKYEYM